MICVDLNWPNNVGSDPDPLCESLVHQNSALTATLATKRQGSDIEISRPLLRGREIPGEAGESEGYAELQSQTSSNWRMRHCPEIRIVPLNPGSNLPLST